jgi:diazepam-binding inhibitor (GABA receptor modulator, acyl-CoA-binding protein)
MVPVKRADDFLAHVIIRMSTDFEKAAQDVKRRTHLANDVLLELYGLYKQATCGDNTSDKPGVFDMRGRAKWNA